MERNITPLELKKFIIEVLGLEDILPEDIENEAPLFGEGLGLDSIDALELGIALRKTYQLRVDGDDPSTREHFRSVASLVAFMASQAPASPSLPPEGRP